MIAPRGGWWLIRLRWTCDAAAPCEDFIGPLDRWLAEIIAAAIAVDATWDRHPVERLRLVAVGEP